MDERLSIWGWETGTGTKFAVVVDAWGKSGNRGSRGIADGDLRGVSYCPWPSRRDWGENGSRGDIRGPEMLICGVC